MASLKTSDYTKARAQVKARRAPCAACGQPIDYDGPRYIRGRENPWAFDCDHIIPRALGGTHNPNNLRAMHVACNRKAGARLGARRRWGIPRRALSAARW